MITDYRHYRRFKVRANAYKERLKNNPSFAKVDEDIVDLLIALNTLPGVATVWSCSGHPCESSRPPKLYVVMALTRKGHQQLSDLFKRYLIHTKTHQPKEPSWRWEASCLLTAKGGEYWTGVELKYTHTENVSFGVTRRKERIRELLGFVDQQIQFNEVARAYAHDPEIQ